MIQGSRNLQLPLQPAWPRLPICSVLARSWMLSSVDSELRMIRLRNRNRR